MKNIFNLIPVFKRKQEIDSTKAEMEFLQNLLYDAWSNRGLLTKEQRHQVLVKFVDQVKNDTEQEVIEIKKNLVRNENTLDLIKNISLFGF